MARDRMGRTMGKPNTTTPILATAHASVPHPHVIRSATRALCEVSGRQLLSSRLKSQRQKEKEAWQSIQGESSREP